MYVWNIFIWTCEKLLKKHENKDVPTEIILPPSVKNFVRPFILPLPLVF